MERSSGVLLSTMLLSLAALNTFWWLMKPSVYAAFAVLLWSTIAGMFSDARALSCGGGTPCSGVGRPPLPFHGDWHWQEMFSLYSQ